MSCCSHSISASFLCSIYLSSFLSTSSLFAFQLLLVIFIFIAHVQLCTLYQSLLLEKQSATFKNAHQVFSLALSDHCNICRWHSPHSWRTHWLMDGWTSACQAKKKKKQRKKKTEKKQQKTKQPQEQQWQRAALIAVASELSAPPAPPPTRHASQANSHVPVTTEGIRILFLKYLYRNLTEPALSLSF